MIENWLFQQRKEMNWNAKKNSFFCQQVGNLNWGTLLRLNKNPISSVGNDWVVKPFTSISIKGIKLTPKDIKGISGQNINTVNIFYQYVNMKTVKYMNSIYHSHIFLCTLKDAFLQLSLSMSTSVQTDSSKHHRTNNDIFFIKPYLCLFSTHLQK